MKKSILWSVGSFGAGGLCATLLGFSQAFASSPANPYDVVAQFGRVLVRIEQDYVDPVDRTRLLKGAVKGMVAELDPHSSYLGPEEFALFRAESEGKIMGGIGVKVDGRNHELVVVAPIEGSPADRAGLRSGDRIIRVDNVSVEGIVLDKVVGQMKGEPGTHVKITIKREGVVSPIDFDLVREVITVASVAVKLLDGDVAYVRIEQFQENTHTEMMSALAGMRTSDGKPLRGVVLDLRNNPGGFVDQATKVADEFLNSGIIFTTRHRGKILDEVTAHAGGIFTDVPAVVLVNEWSASASELVAGALQDRGRALVLGLDSFGKGSVQSITEMPGGTALRLTIARYYTPSGHAIQADGVHPDVVIESNRIITDSLPTLKESDLEGHLSAEVQNRRQENRKKAARPSLSPDGGVPSEMTDVKTTPTDPMEGSDFVLRVGYQLVRASIAGHGPLPR